MSRQSYFSTEVTGFFANLNVLVVIESFPQLDLVEADFVSLEVRRADYLQTRLVESGEIQINMANTKSSDSKFITATM